MAAQGHEERFPPTRLSDGCGFRKETIVGMRRNGRDAPFAGLGPRSLQSSDWLSSWPYALASRLRSLTL
jgi:hypothetical protein